MARARLRDLGITLGTWPPGPCNAITDVPGVLVGQVTVLSDQPRVVRTGVTIVMPREDNVWRNNVFAGLHVLNGAGELTGTHWLQETGVLASPIALTNTHQVGMVRDVIAHYAQAQGYTSTSSLPVAGETWDGWLSDIDALGLEPSHVLGALHNAASGAVSEGNVGAGTGTICHDFKGGIGTASRQVQTPSGDFCVGALVQTNHGDRHLLRVDGVAVGQTLGYDLVPNPWLERPKGGSIIVVLATDAPLLPVQCRRLAQRATIGLARAGAVGNHGSGDMFIAFATGNDIDSDAEFIQTLHMLPHHHLDPLFEAAAEATEEAILNSLTGAESMVGYLGRTAHALPLDDLQRVVKTRGRPA